MTEPVVTTLSDAVERVRDAVDNGVLGLQNRADLSLILAALKAAPSPLHVIGATPCPTCGFALVSRDAPRMIYDGDDEPMTSARISAAAFEGLKAIARGNNPPTPGDE